METSSGLSGSGTLADGPTSSLQASLGGRYATALFELSRDSGALDAVSPSLATLKQALADSADLRLLTTSPLIARADGSNAAAAVAKQLELDATTANFMGVLARNGRLAQLPAVIRAFNALTARHRGEATAEVTSAHPLDEDQVAALKAKLRQRLGRDVAIDRTVDPAILGGLIVKLGSQRIDGSIRTKLNTLANAMKG